MAEELFLLKDKFLKLKSMWLLPDVVAGNVAYVAVEDADAQRFRVGVGLEGPGLLVAVVAGCGAGSGHTRRRALRRHQRDQRLAQRVGRHQFHLRFDSRSMTLFRTSHGLNVVSACG